MGLLGKLLQNSYLSVSTIVGFSDLTEEECSFNLFGNSTGVQRYRTALVSFQDRADKEQILAASFLGILHSSLLICTEKIDLGYCLTYKEVTGEKFKNVLIVCEDNPLVTRNTIYTLLTRATEQVTIMVPHQDDLQNILSRGRDWGEFQTMITEKLRGTFNSKN